MSVELDRSLQAAIGWLELGLPADGLRELDALRPEQLARREVLELRAVLLQQLDRWDEATATYAAICRQPGVPVERFIAWGCCLYELGRVAECRSALRLASAAAERHALWHFHLACYEAILGNCDEARRLVRRALELDVQLRGMVERNSNLRGLLE